VKVADVQVSHDGIDGLPAYGDRTSPRRAQGKQQGQAGSDHGREPADEQGRPADRCAASRRWRSRSTPPRWGAGRPRKGRGADVRPRPGGRGVAGKGIQGGQQFGARGCPEGGPGGWKPRSAPRCLPRSRPWPRWQTGRAWVETGHQPTRTAIAQRSRWWLTTCAGPGPIWDLGWARGSCRQLAQDRRQQAGRLAGQARPAPRGNMSRNAWWPWRYSARIRPGTTGRWWARRPTTWGTLTRLARAAHGSTDPGPGQLVRSTGKENWLRDTPPPPCVTASEAETRIYWPFHNLSWAGEAALRLIAYRHQVPAR